MRKALTRILLGCLLIGTACSPTPGEGEKQGAETPADLAVSVSGFGATPDGPAHLYTLTNAHGITATITDYGATLVGLMAPDKNGVLGNIVLGYDSVEAYVARNPYFGSTVGRYGNRIAKGQFSLDGGTYELVQNNGPNHLHGGTQGFDKVLWQARTLELGDAVGVELTYTSPDMEEGYPGTLEVKTQYLLNNEDELLLTYEARTDAPTIVNLTNHTYFNLAGSGTILDHVLTLQADAFTPVDETMIPTGERRPVEGTPFDFRTPTRIGDRIDDRDQQIEFGGGYDHNYVLTKTGTGLERAAEIFEPVSGRTLTVFTEEPGVQFYTGNFLDGTLKAAGGIVVPYRGGLCLETQHFPDSPNQPEFPSTVLRPGETYSTQTLWKMGVRE